MVKFNRKDVVSKLFKEQDNSDFVRVMLVVFNEMNVKEVVEKIEESGVPFILISGLVNIERVYYDLPLNTHRGYEEIKKDAVVNGSFKSRDLKLVLATILAETKFMKRKADGSLVLNLQKIIDTLIYCRKYLLSQQKIECEISSYLEYLRSFA